jgi:hypothetical protein
LKKWVNYKFKIEHTYKKLNNLDYSIEYKKNNSNLKLFTNLNKKYSIINKIFKTKISNFLKVPNPLTFISLNY